MAQQLLKIAQQSSRDQAYTTSDSLALASAQLSIQNQDWQASVDAYYQIFLNGYFSNNFQNSILQLQKGIEVIPKSAAQAWAKLHTFLGFAYNARGDLLASLDAYESSLPALRSAKDTLRLNKVYGNIGIAYIQLGEYRKAIDQLQHALSTSHLIGDTLTWWNNLLNLGDAYFYQNNWTAAAAQYQLAQQLRDPKDGTFAAYQAELLLQQNQYALALQSNQNAIEQVKERKGDDHQEGLRYRQMRGEIYLKQGKAQKALDAFQQLIAPFQKLDNKRNLGILYCLIAESQYQLQEYDLALNYFHRALQIFVPQHQDKRPHTNPEKRLWSREVWLMEVFKGKGNCFQAKYQSQSDTKDLQLADQHYQLALHFIQYIKLHYETISSKLFLGNYVREFYEAVLASQLTLFAIEQDQQYLQQAFQTAQMANAFVLRESLSEQKALTIAAIHPDTLALLKTQRQEIMMLKRAIEQKPNQSSDTLKNQFLLLEEQHLHLRKAIEERHPLYAQLRYDLQVPKATSIQRQLSDNSLLLKYFMGKTDLYIFSLTQNHFAIDTIQLPPNFTQLVQQYRRAISDLNFIRDSTAVAEQQFLVAAHHLYRLLLKKPLDRILAQQNITQIRVVADGLLHRIPFQALLVEPSDSWAKPDHYVLANYALSYHYFCKMLMEDAPRHPPKGGFMAFGLEFDQYTLEHLQKFVKDSIENKAILQGLRSGNLSYLPFSDDEALELAQLMDGQAWVNQAATKGNFLQHSVKADMIHMATHSILDEDHPNQSALIFTKLPHQADHLLRLDEIYQLDLRARMLVLSACNTGFGPHQIGEGINSLARAFHFAGVPSVTATLWSISDESSKKMMELYYAYLKRGWAKDRALQQAQLDYLQNDQISSPAFRHPVYWAAWMPIGDVEPLSYSGQNGWYYFLAILVFVVGYFYVRSMP
ncbi:MAG: CHAT domain-containing tetratricopeptide repeat protein [Bacteroidota bacterium]